MAEYIAPSVRNITKLFRTASADQVATGAAWYAEAHTYAVNLADQHGLTVETVAGIIAALSPMQSWGANINLAVRFLAEGGLYEGYLRSNLAKARDILAGAAPLDALGGDKVRNFYLSILSAGAEGVCIDRHAYSLAVNTRFTEGTIPNLKGKRYAEVVAAYVRAARILSAEYGQTITPAQVQSVTWTLWRAKFWAVGAFDQHVLAA